MKTEITIFVIFMTDPTTQRRARKSGTTGIIRPPWIFSKYYRVNVYLMFASRRSLMESHTREEKCAKIKGESVYSHEYAN